MITELRFIIWLVLGVVALTGYCIFDVSPVMWPSRYSGNVLNRSSWSKQIGVVLLLVVSGLIGFLFISGIYSLWGLQKAPFKSNKMAGKAK